MRNDRPLEGIVTRRMAQEAACLRLLRGPRTWLTTFESQCAELEREYLQIGDTRQFRARWGESLAPEPYVMRWDDSRDHDFEACHVAEARTFTWIALCLGASPNAVALALARVTFVYHLCEVWGLDDPPEVRAEGENDYALAG